VYRLEGDSLEEVAELLPTHIASHPDGDIWLIAEHEGQNLLWTFVGE
jgi:hypothetical protein